ncbi:MAG TPA: Rieske 2Fe-2S domain-containing protein [Acidimicrobiales bacterium]|jgi:thiosulfate dehydrogenase [quinone] large subunit|nr:Rieske 2Fe-2S domain-containing protein [Acidimicrobiales bacterium]
MAQRTRPVTRAGPRAAAGWSYLAPPPRAPYLFGWSILPLRLFLGITFCFAGLQKLANPNFFNANSPSGIHAQLIAAIRVSPLHSLLGHLLSFATPIGVLIALSELAVGLGAVLGLWTRVAAAGGALLSFTLFLTVSFHSSPYYTGADIVFLFAWLPVIVGGSGGVLSLDAVLAERAHREGGLAPSTVVPVPFSVIQQVCGHFERGTCTARAGRPCQIAPCPVLTERRSSTAPWRPDRVDRRTVVLGGAAVGITGAVALAVAGAAAAIGRIVGGAHPPGGGGTTNLAPLKSSAPTTTSAGSTGGGTAPAGSPIGSAKDVPVRGAAQFTDPRSGQPGLVLQPARGQFVAFNAVCPHAGCTVNYFSGSELIVCPCHGSEFNPTSGAVETGPAQRGLATIAIALGPDGQLYADG